MSLSAISPSGSPIDARTACLCSKEKPEPSRAVLTTTRTRKASRRGIKIHRNFTVEEAARTRGVAKGTVRRWIKSGLPALIDQKPTLILGSDLAQFLTERSTPRQTCRQHECYCVKCRPPRKPAGDMAEFIPLTPTTGNLRGICPICETMMHKRIRRDALEPIGKILAMTFAQSPPRLRE